MDNLLFSVSLFHQYYDNGRLQNFSIVPNEQTQQVLDRYELIAKLEQNLYSIYYLGNQEFGDFSASLQQRLKQRPLVFTVRADAQHFTLISDLPLNQLGVLKYSSDNIATHSSQQPLLLPLFVSGDSAMQSEVAEISIYAEDLFDSRGDRTNSNFEIKVNARETQWNYYVLNSSNIKLINPKISSPDGIELDSPIRTTVGSDDNVLLFSSGERRFTMSETAKHSFDLLSNRDPIGSSSVAQPRAAKRILKGLATPNTNEIRIQSDAGRDYACSQMYVYL